jgi:hypothetical protein
MDGYDLDDTLADVKYEEAGVRGLATVFTQAEVKYRPTRPFVVITARPHSTAALRGATERWLTDNYGSDYKGTYYVSGSESDIIKGKVQKIYDLNLASFTDNNEQILAALKQELPASIALYRLNDNERSRY